MKIYAIFSVLFGLTFALVSERSSMNRCGIFDQELLSGKETDAVGEVIYANGNLRSFVYYWSYIFQVIQILSYFLIALYSCYFAWKRLRREGMKPEVRMMFIKKQIAYVIVNLLMWVCFFIMPYIGCTSCGSRNPIRR
jgi:hypothetical protein